MTEQYFCIGCYDALPRCSGCGSLILDRGIVYRDTNEIFCYNCHKRREHCDVCGHPVSNMYWFLSDGRCICESCHATAISSLTEANGILKFVSDLIKEMFAMYIKHSNRLHFVDKNTINNISGVQSHKTLGVFKRVGENFNIYLERGLPRALTAGVLAHEYTHAWQSENCPSHQSKIIVEGFAMWVEYRILERLDYPREKKQIELRKDIYGKGFHYIKEYERRNSRYKLFEYVRNAIK